MNYFEPHLTPDELRAISAIGLAHMGDAVYETLVRTWLCVHGQATGKEAAAGKLVFSRDRIHDVPPSASGCDPCIGRAHEGRKKRALQ